jgi:opacity protein-like surface antigen
MPKSLSDKLYPNILRIEDDSIIFKGLIMNKKTSIIGIMLLASSSVAMAGGIEAEPMTEPVWTMRPLITASAGGLWTSEAGGSGAGHINTFYFDYDATDRSQSKTVFGGFAGVEIEKSHSWWAAQVGIGYYQPQSFTMSGILTQSFHSGFSPQQYAYEYDVLVQQLMFEGKFLFLMSRYFLPYVTAGFGVAFNDASGFEANFPLHVVSLHFKQHTQATATFQVGVGVDIDLFDHLRAGVGYRFTDLGKSRVSQGQFGSLFTTDVPRQGRMLAQEVLGQLTLII